MIVCHGGNHYLPLVKIYRSYSTVWGPLPKAMVLFNLTFYIYSRSILAKYKVCILIFSNTGHSYIMCTDVSFSATHLLHEGVFAFLILYHIYCRLICPVRSPTSILQCFLSGLLYKRTTRYSQTTTKHEQNLKIDTHYK